MEIVQEFLNCILNINYWNSEHIYFLNVFLQRRLIYYYTFILCVYYWKLKNKQSLQKKKKSFYEILCICFEKEILHANKILRFIRVSLQSCVVNSLSPVLDCIS
jgi:hypothetical protein